MNIKAKLYSSDITIIAIIGDKPLPRAVYVKNDGSISYVYLDNKALKIIDTNYLP